MTTNKIVIERSELKKLAENSEIEQYSFFVYQ